MRVPHTLADLAGMSQGGKLDNRTVPLLKLVGVTRRFDGVVALDAVDFDLRAGEVHALVGANGAGKSTLIKLVSGVFEPDAGEIRIAGTAHPLGSPTAARRAGIVTVHQEAELFRTLSVAENMALAQGLPCTRGGFVRRRQIRRDAEAAMAAVGESIEVAARAEGLSVAERQMTQIAAAVAQRAKVIVFDEPTSALSASETERLMAQIEAFRAAGAGVIYVSHRHDEVFRLADRITVLRDGRHVTCVRADAIDHDGLVAAMIGNVATSTAAREKPRDVEPRVRLRTEKLSGAGGGFRDVTLACHAGEVLGIYGLVGSGRTEFVEALFGIPAADEGTVCVDERPTTIRRPRDAMRVELALVPDDRLQKGTFPGLSVRENIVIAHLRRFGGAVWTSAVGERRAAEAEAATLDIQLQSIEQPIAELSGGNQQKAVLARWLAREPAVLLLDEPTRGIDVRAKAEIHRLIRARADAGCGVVLVSSELSEVLDHADRIVVFREGRVAGEFASGSSAQEVAAAAVPIEPAPTQASAGKRRRPSRASISELGLAAVILALCATLSATAPQFATAGNLWGVASAASVWILLSLAAATVIVAGGIDISIGALLALAAAAAGLVLGSVESPALAIPLAIGAGLAVGAVGGALNAGLALIGGIHPIVVTLGTMTIYRGLLITLTGGEAIKDLPRSFLALAEPVVGGLEGAVVISLTCAVGVQVVWTHHRAGRKLFAYGSNPEAARLIGVRRGPVWLAAFAGGGLLVGVAGIVELVRSGSMQSVLGTGYELRAIAAAVIGGTSITGGRGNVAGVVMGALLLALFHNALVLWHVAPHYYELVVGALIVAAVALDRLWRGGA